ncbi:SRPBCC family protein [Methylomicrobium sp. Wu6]|uniref:SRPBCC family protein n=1 Tax=Methylomicrobium sp. Wu6 TaxID=3107928 RepID=UPI002DD65E63|nr:SRPBCC family protein [Methylomicrobium sp. Wu6]MEC4746945.1 SRPBCC family protein [Methylomicrobium sp. Wu6]
MSTSLQKCGSQFFSMMRKICPVRRSAWLLIATIGLPLATQSAEVMNSSIIQRQGRYMMHSEAVIHAPVSKIRALLMDYENFPLVNPDIKRVEPVGHLDHGGIRMVVSSDFCILAVCLRFDWIQDVRLLPDGDIAMTIVPNRGDFRQGNGRWHLLSNGASTRLIFDFDLTPKYWLPPVFGPWLMKRKLSEEAFEMAQGLERMAISKCC